MSEQLGGAVIPGDIVSVADWINRECDRLGSDHNERGWCHELHGKCRAAGGDDDEIRAAVRAFLLQRHPRTAPEPVRWSPPE